MPSRKVLRFVTLANIAFPLCIVAVLFLNALLTQVHATGIVPDALMLAVMPVTFALVLWKGAALLRIAIDQVPLQIAEPGRSVIAAGLAGAALFGILLTALGPLLADIGESPFPLSVNLAATAWGSLHLAALGLHLSRERRGAPAAP